MSLQDKNNSGFTIHVGTKCREHTVGNPWTTNTHTQS